jgi:hypothetical protein
MKSKLAPRSSKRTPDTVLGAATIPTLWGSYFRKLGEFKLKPKQLTRRIEKAMRNIFSGFNFIGAITPLTLTVGCANT